MRSSVDDNKGWIGPATPEISNGFEFQKGSNRTPNHHRSTMGKPAPSKWDDAQKWLSVVGFARGGGGGGGGGEKSSHHSRSNKPRNSNADDLRLIASASQREREGEDQYVEYDDEETAAGRLEVETKNVDCGESVWRKESSINPTAVIRSVCVRDMGTEMTPIGSQEPSRTATPVRATTPVGRSPVTSPVRASQRGEVVGTVTETVMEVRSSNNEMSSNGFGENKKAMSAMEARAMAWDEAERAKFMAR